MQSVGSALTVGLWVSGVWGAIAAWEAYKGKSSWKRAGWVAWLIHNLTLFGTVGLLLYILLGHRYEFHYAWSHGSRLLPLQYITAALWEGQEGSFLLWMLWHGVLGWAIWLSRDPHRWGLLAGLLATNAYLATFLLGIALPQWSIAIGAGLLWGLWAAEALPTLWRLSGAALLAGVCMLPFSPVRLALIGGLFLLSWMGGISPRAAISALAILLLPMGESWGSFPFLYVWEVRSDMPVGFIPSDGNGLNPLLQSYWMVIHPPVLFSGYAAAALPFWEGLLAVRSGGLTGERSRRLLRWTWLAVGLLGLGIALGAYWAYETLNFGGYWNWDPVENASLAPWLVLVAAAHLIWVWRRQRRGGSSALALTLLPFPLVIYSAYLTRSGVLSDSSVHSFTDLGLGHWLAWGIGVSLGGLLILGLRHLPHLAREAMRLLTRLALAVGGALLLWLAFLLLLLTSLPVLNKAFGTNWTLGSGALQVYYEWMGIFTAPALVLMGYALLKAYRARGWELLLWVSALVLSAIILSLWWAGWDLVYHPAYRSLLQSENWMYRLRGALFLLLDDLLWGGAIVALGAAIAVLIQVRGRSHLWAGLGHSGFAILIIGAILSSGYEKVLSQNFNPRSPGSGDNLFLPQGASTVALGYFVRYEGLMEPVPPIQEVRPVIQEGGQTLWRFRDSLGLLYQVWLPDGLLIQGGWIHPVGQPSVHNFIQANIALLPAEPADHRYRYKVSLTSLDSSRTYPLLLEADLSESSGLLAHPAHVRLWHGDLYVHLTSLPRLDGPPVAQGIVGLGVGDTVHWEALSLKLERLTEVEGTPHPTFRAWLAAWKGLPQLAQRFPVEFAIQEKELVTPTASVPTLGLSVQLEKVSVREGKLMFRLALRRRPDSFITLKILYKPFISLFWGGILLTLVGSFGAWLRHQ
ncbi:MAG: cytochrome c biogenesis protein CcsA [Bacteroidia bacterium]|nr:cytochrome c biogenesis protein CcsA [Bacteroidia bacterium]